MSDMPRPRPPYLHRECKPDGYTYWYVRVRKGKRIPIRSEYGTETFTAEYNAAISGTPVPAPKPADSKSLRWLYERYKDSAEWQLQIAEATRRQRLNIFSGVMKTGGNEPYRGITAAHIEAGRDRRAKTPAQARNYLDAMRGLFRWALAGGYVTFDPTAGVKNPPRKKSKGFPAWTEADVEAYEAKWPIGTKERVWLDVLLYSGLRRGDAVRYGRQHVRNGVGSLAVEKGGEMITVTLPMLPVLQRTLDAGPCGDLTFICGVTRRPLTKESFGNFFSEAARAAGVKKSAHGVRKIAATRCANNGATVAELKALFGWTTDSMPGLYTREADRVRLAKASIEKMNKPETATPETSNDVRARQSET
jgi:integrase